MLFETTPKGFARYQTNRKVALPRLIEYLSTIYGLPGISTSIDTTKSNDCELTQEGIHITINPDSIEDLVHRKRFGVQGVLPLAIADLIVVTHEIYRAVDYKDPTFFIELEDTSFKRRAARHFFNTSIDDMAADVKLVNIPLITQYAEAFNSRFTTHDMVKMPHHIQFINALRIMLLEKNPSLVIAPEVEETLSDFKNNEVDAPHNIRNIIDASLSYKDRHDLADTYLYPPYLTHLRNDLASHDLYSIGKLYEEENILGALKSVKLGDLMMPSEPEMQEYNEELFRVTEDQIEQSVLESIPETENLSGDPDDDSPGLILPRTGESPDDLTIVMHSEEAYRVTARRWHTVISDVATLFLKLATPKENLTVPRYRHVAAIDGSRLNPQALTQAHIQLITGSPRPIWQPIEKRIRYQELQFSGLDFYLLLDVSGSMGGANAEYATAMAVCLIEGLQLARTRAEADPKQSTVDVRTQLLAFGAGWVELTPLCKELTFTQKETAHYNLMNPSSSFTAINGALKKVRENALEVPERNVICLIVSDGLFSDNLHAFKTVQNMPNNVYVGHISIGDALGIPITLHSETVYDPKVLPKKLHSILLEYFTDIETRL